MQIAFSLTSLHTFTESQSFSELVSVEPHPDNKLPNGQDLVALNYLDGSGYASWIGVWKKATSAGAGERFVIDGNLISAYRSGIISVFGCIKINAVP